MESSSTFPDIFWTSMWVEVTDAPIFFTEFVEVESTTNSPNFTETLWPTVIVDPVSTKKGLDIVALIILPLVLICGLVGNALVCIVVFRFTALRIVANYFIVSLAVADLAVCGLVMPLAAYQELSGSWGLGEIMCDLWVTLDILMSTASIWNLCVISLDRYMAITRPVWYALRRTPVMAFVAITVAWVLSVVLSIPALIFVGGSEDDGSSELCLLNISPAFAIVSSFVSFYIPCAVVLIVYQRILVAARHHSRRRVRPAIASMSNAMPATVKNTTHDQGNASSIASTSGNTSNPSPATMNTTNNTTNTSPGTRNANNDANCISLESHENTNNGQTNEKSRPNGIINLQKYDNRQANNLEKDRAYGSNDEGSSNKGLPRTESEPNNPHDMLEDAMEDTAVNDNDVTSSVRAPATKRVQLPADNAPATVITTTAMDARSTNGTSQRVFVRRRHISVTRERRAAFVLAIVVGVFICCWLPFFIINLYLGICPSCSISPVAFQVVTWLGWCNSIINPIIYTTFNREFRNAFKKTLFCGHL